MKNEIDEFLSDEPAIKEDYNYQYHPFANIFPMLIESELKELAEDIRFNGLLNKITLYENKILDGRNRYEACKIANIKPEFIILKDIDPLQYVISNNLKRRHLNASQRALIAADLANMKSGR